jgi:tetratricopeptide (TPR) repeat protein
MTRIKTRLAGLAGLVAVASALLGGTLSGPGGRGSDPADITTMAEATADREHEPLARLIEGFSTGDTAAFVRRLERRVAAAPSDGRSLVLLGLAYQQRARETADATFYARSEAALERARHADGDETLVLTGLGALAVSRHRFSEALTLAKRALWHDAGNASAYGVLGDALLSVGRYRPAFEAYDKMAALSPSVASYARVAHGRKLLGRPQAAIDALELSRDIGTPVPEHGAWMLVQLGNLHFELGRLRHAEIAYRRALARVPAYVHADAGLARLDASRGRYKTAIRRYRSVVERLPLLQYAGGLAEVLAAAGRGREAEDAYRLARVIGRLLRASGVRTDLETALVDLDRDRRLRDALSLARAAHRVAPSVQAEDVLAWALYKNGRCREARAHSRRALRLGTRDALMHFHRGMIERCLGNEAASRSFLAAALEINPYFSPVYAPVARALR